MRYSVLDELPAANTMLLASAYQRYKADNDLLDYDDLLVLAYQHLSGKLKVESGKSHGNLYQHGERGLSELAQQ